MEIIRWMHEGLVKLFCYFMFLHLLFSIVDWGFMFIDLLCSKLENLTLITLSISNARGLPLT
jgi:hypothetical protein